MGFRVFQSMFLKVFDIHCAQHSPLSFVMVGPKGKFKVSTVVYSSLSLGANWPDITSSKRSFLNSPCIYDQDQCVQTGICLARLCQFCKKCSIMSKILTKDEKFQNHQNISAHLFQTFQTNVKPDFYAG